MEREPSDLEIDIANMLSDRISTAMRDAADTARRGGLSKRDTMTMMITVLMAQAVTGLLTAKYTELEAVQLTSDTYREIVKTMLRAREMARAAAKH